jgi:acetyl esterase
LPQLKQVASPVTIAVRSERELKIDPLAVQSIALADKLSRLGVSIETLFYPQEHTPPLEHEYQFNVDLADGRQALARMLTFLETAFK